MSKNSNVFSINVDGVGVIEDIFFNTYKGISQGDEISNFESTDYGFTAQVKNPSDPDDYSVLMNVSETISSILLEQGEDDEYIEEFMEFISITVE